MDKKLAAQQKMQELDRKSSKPTGKDTGKQLAVLDAALLSDPYLEADHRHDKECSCC